MPICQCLVPGTNVLTLPPFREDLRLRGQQELRCARRTRRNPETWPKRTAPKHSQERHQARMGGKRFFTNGPRLSSRLRRNQDVGYHANYRRFLNTRKANKATCCHKPPRERYDVFGRLGAFPQQAASEREKRRRREGRLTPLSYVPPNLSRLIPHMVETRREHNCHPLGKNDHHDQNGERHTNAGGHRYSPFEYGTFAEPNPQPTQSPTTRESAVGLHGPHLTSPPFSRLDFPAPPFRPQAKRGWLSPPSATPTERAAKIGHCQNSPPRRQGCCCHPCCRFP